MESSEDDSLCEDSRDERDEVEVEVVVDVVVEKELDSTLDSDEFEHATDAGLICEYCVYTKDGIF